MLRHCAVTRYVHCVNSICLPLANEEGNEETGAILEKIQKNWKISKKCVTDGVFFPSVMVKGSKRPYGVGVARGAAVSALHGCCRVRFVGLFRQNVAYCVTFWSGTGRNWRLKRQSWACSNVKNLMKKWQCDFFVKDFQEWSETPLNVALGLTNPTIFVI